MKSWAIMTDKIFLSMLCYVCNWCPVCSTDEGYEFHSTNQPCNFAAWITVRGPMPWLEWDAGNYYWGPYELDH